MLAVTCLQIEREPLLKCFNCQHMLRMHTSTTGLEIPSRIPGFELICLSNFEENQVKRRRDKDNDLSPNRTGLLLQSDDNNLRIADAHQRHRSFHLLLCASFFVNPLI
jgi:hypothetical protein